MALISEEKIQQIINEADIVSIISAYIKISKKGRNYWGVCPFHEDSNPSMSISQEKKIYKCFSCGASGNAIGFIQNFEKIDFIAALKKVATSVNIELNELSKIKVIPKYTPAQERIFQINEEAMNFYQIVLNSKLGSAAKEYLANRNISKDELVKWKIGYATSEVKLYDKLIEKGFTQLELNDAGLISIKDEVTYDYYFNRIIFPILNDDSRVIGFSARALLDIKPKYINSRENLVFKKSELAYNIQNVIRTVNLKKSVIVLEGFMDVISLDKIGVDNAIALMGTSLSDYHLKLFRQLKAEVKLFLDGDEPGVRASIKAIKKILEAKLKLSIINNLTANDPDELIKSGEQEKVLKMINESIYPINYVAEKLITFINKNNPDELNNYFNQLFELIKIVDNEVITDSSLQIISKVSGTEIDKLQKYYINFVGSSGSKVMQNQLEPNASQYPEKQVIGKIQKNSGYDRAEKRVFISLLNSDQYLEQVAENIDSFDNPNIKMIVGSIIEVYRDGTYRGSDLKLILKLLENKGMNYSNVINKLVEDNMLNMKMSDNEMSDSLISMQIYQLEKEIKFYEVKMYEAQNNIEKKSYMKLIDGLHEKVIILINKRKRGL